jgi:hypothetical protein
MPSAAQSRVKVTDTHGPFPVGEFSVCRVDGTVALHLGTPVGRFVFHVREPQFVKHARGDCDHQGKPWRTLAAIEAESVAAETIIEKLDAGEDAEDGRDGEDAEESRGAAAPFVGVVVSSGFGEVALRSAKAYAELVRDPALSVRAAADRYGIRANTLYGWISTNRRAEWAAVRAARKAGTAARGPLLKSGGRIL